MVKINKSYSIKKLSFYVLFYAVDSGVQKEPKWPSGSELAAPLCFPAFLKAGIRGNSFLFVFLLQTLRCGAQKQTKSDQKLLRDGPMSPEVSLWFPRTFLAVDVLSGSRLGHSFKASCRLGSLLGPTFCLPLRASILGILSS